MVCPLSFNIEKKEYNHVHEEITTTEGDQFPLIDNV